MTIQFFTSIPIPYVVPMDRVHIERAIRMFPVLGLLLGFIYSFLLYVLMGWTPFSTLAISFIMWLVPILLTGGIHLDGWMDSSDAYFSYRDQKKRLEIMKDPRVGAFGVLSVIVLLSARMLFIYEVVSDSVHTIYLYIILIPFLSRSVMGVLLVKVRQAKEDGLGSLFQNAVSRTTLWVYPVYVLIVLGVFLFLWPEAFLSIVWLVLAAILLIIFFSKKIIQWFDGMTGDVLGASVEGVETLLWMILWLWHYFAMG
jgi:adenosylcobinamide-GDP ribazoletransferase